MALTLLLPWFPILLGVGVGARLLGRARGTFLGLLCAMFWTLLVQTSTASRVWVEPWTIAALVAGAVAIVAIGAWAGEHVDEQTALSSIKPLGERSALASNEAPSNNELTRLSQALEQFEEWFCDHRDDPDPWPAFDQFIRTMLNRCCQATHVRPYRVVADERELVPLRELDPLSDASVEPVGRGVVNQVVTSGRSYVAGIATDDGQGQASGDASSEPIAWCFAVHDGPRTCGVVTVGRVGLDPQQSRTLMTTTERLVHQFWRVLSETMTGRTAVQLDPVSGLLVRPVFMKHADQVLKESQRHGEPVTLAVIALEGLRELNDCGKWEQADELIEGISRILQRKVRTDDRIGRFDGSRFVMLLRRVDAELGSLIAGQLLGRLRDLCNDATRWGTTVRVRCGLAVSGAETADLTTLLTHAMAQCQKARTEGKSIVIDASSMVEAGVES